MNAIIFDIDGTLWDTTDIIAQAYNSVISREDKKLPLVTSATLKSLFGKTVEEIGCSVFAGLPSDRQSFLMEQCIMAEFQFMKKNPPEGYPGLQDMLHTLYEQWPLFLASNCPVGYIEAFLSYTATGSYFTDFICQGETKLPKADNISILMKRHNISKAIYIGDTAGDMQSSKKAGAIFLHAAYGFGCFSAPFSVSDLREIPDAVSRLIV